MSGTKATYHGLGYGKSVSQGTQTSLEECKKQFEWHPWNCPQQDFDKIFSKNHPLPPTRETAFIHAIINAGIVHAVAQNCSRGDFNECGCHDRRSSSSKTEEVKGGFRWGGCSDDINFGIKIAESFLDDEDAGHDPKALMNAHNNNVGRMVCFNETDFSLIKCIPFSQAIKNTMVKKCKCHGVSGSCTTQTCWMKVADFHEVGNYLKETYRKAMKIGYTSRGNALGRVKKNIADQLSVSAISTSVPGINDNVSPSRMKIQEEMKNLPLSRLAFTEDSPSYCSLNRTSSSKDTVGRRCSRRKGKEVPLEEKKSCRNLCRTCGLKVKKHKKKVINKHCNCKLEFCCEVKCETCVTEETYFTCSL